MTARVCTCIRAGDPRVVAVISPTCGVHRAYRARGVEPTFVIYDETTRADLDARRTAAALGRLIRAAAWLYIAAVLWVSIGADHLTPLHWTALAAATPLSLWLTTTHKEKP